MDRKRTNKDAAARSSDPSTSHEAADHVNESGKATVLEGLVLDALRKGGILSAEEVAHRIGVDKQSITPRFVSLERKGLILRTDIRATNYSGRSSQTWRAAPWKPQAPVQLDLLR